MQYIQPYLHQVFGWIKKNNLTLNPHKTTSTLSIPDHAVYKSSLDFKINNTTLPMAMHPKVVGITLVQNPHTVHTFATSHYKHTFHYK